MDPIAVLMQEHQLILKALDALEACAAALEQTTDVTASDIAGFARFIRDFADARHHNKEEGVLFAEMIAMGFPSEGGPIAVMLMEHDEGRALTRTLTAIGEQSSLSEADRARAADTARAYAALLRQHIWKEDNILYPMAAQHFDDDRFRSVATRCKALDADRDSAGTDVEMLATANALIARYAPQHAV